MSLPAPIAPHVVKTRVWPTLDVPRYRKRDGDRPACLDLRRFRPRAFESFVDVEQMDDGRPLPLVILGFGQTLGERAKGDIEKAIPFVAGTPQYVEISFRKLFDLFPRLDDSCRILAAQVMSDYPVHMYFDLDGKDARYQGKEQTIVLQFREMLTKAFRQAFGRDPDLSGEHWEIGSTSEKTSLHCHIISEAFVDGHEFAAFMKNNFRQAVERQMDHMSPKEKEDFLLCHEESEDERREHLVDQAIYMRNGSLRLGGNRKPGKGLMRQCVDIKKADGTVGELFSENELLWRGLPNYSLPTRSDYQLLTTALPKGAPGPSEEVVMRSQNVRASFEKPLAAQELEPFKWVLSNTLDLGPLLQFDKAAQKISPQGVRELLIECKSHTAQCVIKSQEGAPYYHTSNRTIVTLRCDYNDPCALVARIMCLSPSCRQACQAQGWLPLSRMLEQQHKAFLEDNDCMPFDHPLMRTSRVFGPNGCVQAWLASPEQTQKKRKAQAEAEDANRQAKRLKMIQINHHQDVEICDDQLQPVPGLPHLYVIDEAYLYDSKGADSSAANLSVPSRKQVQMDSFFDTNTHLGIRATQGTGKSEAMLHQIKRRFLLNPKLRVLWLSTRRAYADDMCKRWNSFFDQRQMFHGATKWAPLVNYMDVPRSDATDASSGSSYDGLTSQQCVMVSLESLPRFLNHRKQAWENWDLVVLDEVQEIMHNLSSKTIQHRTVTNDILQAFLQEAQSVWAADADLEIDPVTQENWFLTTYCGKPFTYLVNQRRTLDREYVLHLEYVHWTKELQEQLMQRKKICVVTNVKSQALVLKELLEKTPGLLDDQGNGLAPKLLVVTGDSSDELKQSVLKDRVYTDCDVFIFTPFIGSGVNLDQPHFDVTFLYASDQSSTARQVFQQLNRVRHLNDNRVHAFIKASDPTPESTQPQSLAETAARVGSNISLLMDSEHLNATFDPRAMAYRLKDSPYNGVYIRNEWERHESKLHFQRLLVNKMKQSGGKVSTLFSEPVTKQEKQSIKALTDKVKHDQLLLLAQAADFKSLIEKEATEESIKSGNASEEDKLRMRRFHVQELYGMLPLQLLPIDDSDVDMCSSRPRTREVNEEFLKAYGAEHVQKKFCSFRFATCARTVELGGPAAAAHHEALAHVKDPLQGERVEHVTPKFVIMKQLEDVLSLLGFDKILTCSADVVVNPVDLAATIEADEGKKRILRDCKLFSKIKPREKYSYPKEWINDIVRQCRLFLLSNFGVTFQSHRQRHESEGGERLTEWTLDLDQWLPWLETSC